MNRLSTDGRNRLARAQRAVARQGLAALLVRGTNLVYLTGYPTVERTLARPMVATVPVGASILILHVSRVLEARRYSWVEDVRTYEKLSVAPMATIGKAFSDANGSARIRSAEPDTLLEPELCADATVSYGCTVHGYWADFRRAAARGWRRETNGRSRPRSTR